MTKLFRFALASSMACLVFAVGSYANAVTTISLTTPVAGSQFNTGASFDCNGTLGGSYEADNVTFVYVISYDLDGVSIVKSQNAGYTWPQAVWTPGTLIAPFGNPPCVVSNFNVRAQAWGNMMQVLASTTVVMKVKGPPGIMGPPCQ